MVERPDPYELVFAALAGAVGVAGSYAVAGYTPAFIVAPIDQQVVNMTPGQIVTFMIENVGEAGHLIHIAMAFGIAIGLFSALAFAGIRVAEYVGQSVAGGAVAGTGGWALAFLLTREPVLALGGAVPLAVATAVATIEKPEGEYDPTRRRTLGLAAGVFAFVGGALAGGTFLHGSSNDELAGAPNADGSVERLEQAEAAQLDLASESLPGLVSEIENFYNVDIAEFKPEVPAEEWSLTFTGDVENEVTITFDDLTERDAENRLISLRCVGEDLNGKKLDTAVWTGTPIRPLLEEADPNGDCNCAMLYGEDDYFVQFPVEVLATGFLAWGMNGNELPKQHGHPVRVLIPGNWGETNVKWLTEIEMLDMEEDGYWEQRGWEGTGEVKTVAKLWDDGITELDDGRIELAGHAYAGTRGISNVEVSTDGGETWTDAELSAELPDEDVWRQWRHTFEPDGTHDVVVRATDGTGELQTQEPTDSAPDGAAGWVQRTVGG